MEPEEGASCCVIPGCTEVVRWRLQPEPWGRGHDEQIWEGWAMGKRSELRLTAKTVAGAPRGALLWDAEVKGFGLRVMPSGTRTYLLKYRAGARQRWFTIGQHGSPWTAEMAR